MLISSFVKAIRRNRLIHKHEGLILAVSGGPDSVCMLRLFCSLQEEYRFKLVCAHFNHCLRKEADDDAEFVEKLCRKLGVKFVSAKKNVNKFFKGDSLEQTARRLRFDFFLSCSRSLKIKKIAIAHNKNDVVETVLMHILRGTALRGLRAIVPVMRYRGMIVVRPMLEISKKDILAWLKQNNFTYRVDKTNLQDKFLRNRVRHKLIGILREFNPNVEQALFNLSKIASYDYDFLYRYAHDEFNSLKRISPGLSVQGADCFKLNLGGLKKLHPAVIMEVIRIAIEEAKGSLKRLELRHLEEVMDLISCRPSGSIVHLPQVEVRKECDSIFIKPLIL